MLIFNIKQVNFCDEWLCEERRIVKQRKTNRERVSKKLHLRSKNVINELYKTTYQSDKQSCDPLCNNCKY